MATVTIKNTDRLIKRLNKLSELKVEDTMKKAVSLVEAQAKLLAPSNMGTLKNSIHMSINKGSNNIEGRVFTSLEYAPYVEFGTGIKGNGSYPYKTKGLKLSYRNTPWVYTPDDGETFYTTRGQRAQPFMYPALKNNEKRIKQMFKDTLKENIRSSIKGG